MKETEIDVKNWAVAESSKWLYLTPLENEGSYINRESVSIKIWIKHFK